MAALGTVPALGLSEAATAHSSRSSAPTVLAGAAALPKNLWFSVGGSPIEPTVTKVRKFTACVRRNGIPSLPNYRVSGGEVWVLLPPGLTRSSSRVKKAARACEKFSPLPPGALNRPPGDDDGPSTSSSGG